MIVETGVCRLGGADIIPLFCKSGLGVVFPVYPTACRFPRREGEENVRERARLTARRDAAVQFVTKPEIKQHRE